MEFVIDVWPYAMTQTWVAQLEERPTFNRVVVGSIPTSGEWKHICTWQLHGSYVHHIHTYLTMKAQGMGITPQHSTINGAWWCTEKSTYCIIMVGGTGQGMPSPSPQWGWRGALTGCAIFKRSLLRSQNISFQSCKKATFKDFLRWDILLKYLNTTA